MNINYISLGKILFSVLNNPLCQELTHDEAAEYSLDYIKLLGAPLTYLDKVEDLKVCDYKVELPCDLLYVKGIKFHNGLAFRYASDNFHVDQDNESNHRHHDRELTYSIQKGILFTSIDDCDIKISYKAIALDEDGYPLIPDNVKVKEGLRYYIMFRYLEPLWMMGKITDKAFEVIQQKYFWYIGAADASLRNVSPDQLETVMNGVNRIIRSSSAHTNSFKNLGEKEILKRYNE